ncbi:amidohydrolase family protein [Jiella mangrovi]|uniref:Amidohydrolase family protein n=1 Tax=Jiella mangrovi TaxID=2821407 RepID=A0ABS4BEC3_9HYPH|nr:amidohydrolase family protein [Jiella mangrovi]MBP0615102.1 amidohydrolase family protein [Jiella mangrovi]
MASNREETGGGLFDIVIRGGRVIDPESGRDEIADVAIRGDAIAAVGADLGPAERVIEARGLVVAPGFVDLHAHGQSVPADRMQAFDGVTTTLELEVGALPVGEWYDVHARMGRVLNYGTAAAWLFARKAVMIGLDLDASQSSIAFMGAGSHDMRWSVETAGDREVEEIVALVRQGLDEGAIGIGIPNGYAPGAGLKELTRICDQAYETGCPTYTHIPYASNIDPKSAVESYVRLIGLAGATGAHMHVCHLNSTSLQDIERAAEILQRAQAQGLPVTVEAYPYGTGSTVVGAGFFTDPEFIRRTGTGYDDIQLVRNGHRFTDVDDLVTAREKDPSDLVLWHFLDVEANDRHRELLDVSITYPGGAIASDAVPWTLPDGSLYFGEEWPLPEEVSSHPRSSGTFTRFLRQYVRERGAVSLMEAIAKCTLIPARVIEGCAPQMSRKARLKPGCDADIVVFDPETVTDKATFEAMNRTSEGVVHLLVNGRSVIADGTLDREAAPGRPVRREPR